LSIPESHPLYDHQDDHFSRPADCPDPLCLRMEKDSTICFRCPLGRREPALARPARAGWGGKRRGAGAPKGSLNHLVNGSRSALIRRAVELLADHKELRPFLLLLARAAAEGEIPQTTRRLILHSLGKTTLGMQAATIKLRRLRDGQTAQ
jgi:hypothetical protein